jgi:serine/threonine-protein kinase
MQYLHAGEPLPFLVMELLEGKNLQQLLDERGKLDAGALVWVARQLGRALDVAHKQGIVHRDLKPSNVFLARDEDGEAIVKLCDFGIAKLINHPEDLTGPDGLATRTGALLGTPMYMAPELLRGAGSAVPATDQWSLGLIAFRALAGSEYFGQVRGFPELVLTIANDPLVPPSQRAPALPAAFDGWFARSCARVPGERWADVPAQVAALEAALGRPAARPMVLDDGGGAQADARRGARASVAGGDETALAPPVVATRARAAPPVSRRRVAWLAGTVAWAVAAIVALAWLGVRATAERNAQADIPARATAAASAPRPPEPQTEPTPKRPTPTTAPPTAPAPAVPVAAAPEPAPAAPAKQPASRAAKHHRQTTAKPSVEPARAAPAAPAQGLPKGAGCQRSAECASGRCAAETCL